MIELPLQPVTIGRAIAPNRLVFGPHETNLCRGRAFSERSVAYYRRRAAGGCGVLITETASVHESDWPYERAPLAAECGPGWAAIAAAVRAASPSGALVLAALGHAGGQGSSAYSQRALWAPSQFPDPATREIPQAMEPDEIEAVVAGFADAAASAVASGLDGVEINAGQLSLLRQFLSGLTNQRPDDYGTDRSRLVRRVVAAVRAAVGPEPIVGLRLGCDELAPWAGITPEAAPDLAVGLAEGLDYVAAVRAPAFDVGGTRPDGHTEAGFAVPLADALRRALPHNVAVMAQGSIIDPAMAEAILAAGSADLVEMTRAQIADPDLAAKLAAGVPEQVRPCVLCNQRCQVRDARNPLVSCIGEPFSGYESEDVFPPGAAARSLDVLVIGAGPAGLEAARVAASRGHRVELVESGPRPGGLVATAAAGAGRSHLARLGDWLAAECERLGVQVATGRTIGAEEMERRLADGTRVVLCTGSRHEPTVGEGDGSVAVLTAADVLRAAHEGTLGTLPAGPVVVADPVGDSVGVAVGELLAAHGRHVVLVTGDLIAGVQLSRSGDLAPANARLARAGVRVAKGSIVRQLAGGAVQLENTYTGEKEDVPAAVLVEVTFGRPDEALWRDHPGLVRAGDAVAPRTIYEAVLEGRRAALALEDPR